MRIIGFIWLDEIVEKLAVKHGLKISDDTHGMQSSDIEILKDGSIVIG